VFIGTDSSAKISEVVIFRVIADVARDGIEPPTQRFSVSRSTD
jgi:hypothetical protein